MNRNKKAPRRLRRREDDLKLPRKVWRITRQANHVLKIAMIFQLAIYAENSDIPARVINRQTLQTAIEHSEHCLTAAEALDRLANRSRIAADADILLANIIRDFGPKATNGMVALFRTTLTGKYAHHSGRRGALTPDDLYLRLIPDLIRRGKAREIPHPSKQSSFAFKVEDE